MRLLTVFALGVCLSAASVARAENPANFAQTSAAPKQDPAFALFVEIGDRERLAGRYATAAAAYDKALELYRHPVISGRLGLVLMKLGQLDRAAELLHAALEHGQGVSVQERREVTEAYDKAKALTTWVNVDISQAGAKVTCDGEPQNREGFSSFWMFTKPGEHTMRATLDGYVEAVETFTTKPGEEISIRLNLVPVAPERLPEDEQLLRKKRAFPPHFLSSNVATDPNYSPKEDPSYGEPKATKAPQKKSGPRFSVNGGIVTVFGVASWNPAVGAVVGVGLRPHENISFGLEGRAAWLTTGVGGGQISAMTAGGTLSACGHLRWFFGCALGYVGTIRVAFSEQSYEAKSGSFVKPGLGGRLGANISVGSSFIVRPSVEILGLASGMKVVAGKKVVADQPGMMMSGQVIAGWEF